MNAEKAAGDAGRHFSDGHPSGRAHAGVYASVPSTLRPRARAASSTRSSPLQSQIWGPSCWTSDHETSSRTQSPSTWASSRAAARSAALIPGRSSPKARPVRGRGATAPPGEAAAPSGVDLAADPTGGVACARRVWRAGWVGSGAARPLRASARPRWSIAAAAATARKTATSESAVLCMRPGNREPTAFLSTPDRRSLIGGVSQGPFHGPSNPVRDGQTQPESCAR